MPCEVVPLRVDFSKMAAIAMETESLSTQFRFFFLAYLVPPDVDVVPIKFHQFLFGK
jgi:hypothetical protein